MTPLNYYIPDTSNRINNRYVPNDPRLARADGARLQADATISARSGFPGKVERKNEGVPRCDESQRFKLPSLPVGLCAPRCPSALSFSAKRLHRVDSRSTCSRD